MFTRELWIMLHKFAFSVCDTFLEWIVSGNKLMKTIYAEYEYYKYHYEILY